MTVHHFYHEQLDQSWLSLSSWPSRCAEAAGQEFRERIATENKRPYHHSRMWDGVSPHSSSQRMTVRFAEDFVKDMRMT